jgi:glycine cleavage system H protein
MLKVAKSHAWARLEGDVVAVGITAYAVKQLGDVVYIELPKVGARIKAGQAFGEIESVKAAAELFAPVDGTVTAVNAPLTDELGILQADAYKAGWMIRVKPDHPSPLDDLMTMTQYEGYLKTL